MFPLVEVFTNQQQTELKVTRVWAFGNVNTPTTGSVYFQVLNESLSSTGQYINYDESTGKGSYQSSK